MAVQAHYVHGRSFPAKFRLMVHKFYKCVRRFQINCPFVWSEGKRILSVSESLEDKEQILDVLGIVEKLGEQLDQFEKLKETIDATKKSASRLIPSMKEEKKQLKEKTRERREKIEEIGQEILKLEKQKAELNRHLQSEEQQISRIDGQMKLISRLS